MRVRARLALAASAAVVLSLVGVAPDAFASMHAAGDVVKASTLMSLLTSQADDTTHPYSRDQFNLWIDADGDGCNTRYEVLIAQSTTPVNVGSGCTLTNGTWVSPYDNATWTDPANVDIDHVVPLADAWRSGAWAWTSTLREQYANDLDVPYALIAVTDNVNQAKGDSDPAHWMPSNTAYDCQYAINWALIKYRWSLTVDPAESSALSSDLSGTCGDTDVTLPLVKNAQVSTPGTPTTTIAPFSTGITRLSGATRYETAVAASQKYAPGVPAVFVATGTNFPDALSAAAAAALVGGPLLLTAPDSLPAVVATEIQRLAPAHIYVIGGTSAVNAAVLNSLAGIAPTTRLAGADRYATGLAIVNSTFTSSPTAFIATGSSFPDALAATGAAGAQGAAVILVNGSASSLTAETLNALTQLGVTTVSIAGGTAAVSSGIEQQLRNSGRTVTRYGGATRYETATQINSAYFVSGSTDTMFLATGTSFPDALAGAAIAGRLHAPLFITQQDCVPQVVHDGIVALGASKRVVMGGQNAVSDAAANNTACQTATLPPPPGPPANPGDTKNCSDFATWAQAQNWYLTYYPYYGDVAHLDADHDGIACESLPGAP